MAKGGRLRAERKVGQLLKQMDEKGERAKPGQAGGKPKIDGKGVRPSIAPKLSDLGISKDQSSKFQLLADVSEEEFEKAISERKPSCTLCVRPC